MSNYNSRLVVLLYLVAGVQAGRMQRKSKVMKKLYLLNSLLMVLLLLNTELYPQNFTNETDFTKEKPTQYRRGIELQEGYQNYDEYYSGKNLNEEKRSLFPLSGGTGVWTELSPGIPRVTYFGIQFINPDTGWAVGNLGAIIKTTNGGDDLPKGQSSWTISETNTNTLLLKVHTYDGQIVIVTGYDGIILRSADGGETFTQIVSGVGSGIDLWGVQMLNDTLGYVCGLNQTLLKTTDAGLTWQNLNTGFNQHYWALEFLDESYGMIACGGGKILKTTDGGNSWTEHQAGDASALYAINIIDTLHIAAAGSIGKNVYSSDGGITWLQNGQLQHDELNSIKFIDTQSGYTIGTYQAESWGIRKTTNRGVSWFSPPSPNLSEWELELLPGDVGYSVGSDLWIAKTTGGYDNWAGLFLNAQFVDVHFTNELNGYAADGRYIGGPLYKTTDGGENWFSLPNFPSNVFTSTLQCVTFTDSVTGFAGSAPARIVKTTDAGDSWYIVNRTGLTDTIGLINRFFFINQTTGWAVTTRGGILKTTDTGENWFAQLNAGANVIFQSIHFVDSLYGWSANLNARPYKTTNGGQNWIHQTSLNLFSTRDILFKDSINGFVINGLLEQLRTTNSGNNWFTQTNSQNVIRTFGWLSKSHIFIIGDGVYETNDSGNVWQEILELRNVGLIKFHSPKNYIGYSVGNLGLIYRYIDTTVIPVELNSFSTSVVANKVILNWSTSSELNNRGFEIERSLDKTHWKIIGFVDGNGTTIEIKNYTFTDYLFENSPQNLFYRLKQIDFDGTFEYSDIIEVEVGIPLDFFLSQNYPNPFNPETNIEFHIPIDALVTLKVYDILGREVITLLNEPKTAGRYKVNFDATNLSSGVYFYKLIIGGYTQIKKMILLQ
jgi:photosystem II stability/assembly factor-like uncharacterized protein